MTLASGICRAVPWNNDNPQFVHKQLHLAHKVSAITADGDSYLVDTTKGQKSLLRSVVNAFLISLCAFHVGTFYFTE